MIIHIGHDVQSEICDLDSYRQHLSDAEIWAKIKAKNDKWLRGADYDGLRMGKGETVFFPHST